ASAYQPPTSARTSFPAVLFFSVMDSSQEPSTVASKQGSRAGIPNYPRHLQAARKRERDAARYQRKRLEKQQATNAAALSQPGPAALLLLRRAPPQPLISIPPVLQPAALPPSDETVNSRPTWYRPIAPMPSSRGQTPLGPDRTVTRLQSPLAYRSVVNRDYVDTVILSVEMVPDSMRIPPGDTTANECIIVSDESPMPTLDNDLDDWDNQASVVQSSPGQEPRILTLMARVALLGHENRNMQATIESYRTNQTISLHAETHCTGSSESIAPDHTMMPSASLHTNTMTMCNREDLDTRSTTSGDADGFGSTSMPSPAVVQLRRTNQGNSREGTVQCASTSADTYEDPNSRQTTLRVGYNEPPTGPNISKGWRKPPMWGAPWLPGGVQWDNSRGIAWNHRYYFAWLNGEPWTVDEIDRDPNQDDRYIVERIWGPYSFNGVKHYRVCWHGYAEDTWEPVDWLRKQIPDHLEELEAELDIK
ncbi:MAG: hypothetical protein M1830_008609, partial [Pleopsidium flavum]